MDSQLNLTLFVDNLPISIGKIWIYNLFSKFGKIRDIFIPNKRSKITNKQFGFVRFVNSAEAVEAARNTNGAWYWGQKLIVHIAKFGGRKIHQNISRSEYQNFNKALKTKWVYRVKNPIVAQPKPVEPHSNQNQDNTHFQFFQNEGKVNLHHSFSNMLFQPIGSGGLLRSAVAKIRKLLSPKDLKKVFNMESSSVDDIKPIGGRYVIITFPNAEARDETIMKEWTSIWFENISPWSGDSAKDERFVWLSCFGMPLNGWSYQNFKIIGECWGDFIQVDDSTLHGKSFDRGRILIAANQPQRISGTIEMELLGKKYSVRVEEDESFRTINNDYLVHEDIPNKYKDAGKVELEEDVILKGDDINVADNSSEVNIVEETQLILEESQPVHREIEVNLGNSKVAIPIINEEQSSNIPCIHFSLTSVKDRFEMNLAFHMYRRLCSLHPSTLLSGLLLSSFGGFSRSR